MSGLDHSGGPRIRTYKIAVMFKITIVSVGALKERYFAEAAAEYEKRCSPYAKIVHVNLREEPDGAGHTGDIEAALAREGARILECLPQRAYKVALCVEGRSYTSEQFAALCEKSEKRAGRALFCNRVVARSQRDGQSRLRSSAFGVRADVSAPADACHSCGSALSRAFNLGRRKISQMTGRNSNFPSGAPLGNALACFSRGYPLYESAGGALNAFGNHFLFQRR